MAQWLRKKFTDHAKACEFAQRKESVGCLTVILPYLHGWTVSWTNLSW
jgi:hypothetical protein